jgi:hypothetical protein
MNWQACANTSDWPEGRVGDHRDWPTIDAWADRIAVVLPSLRSTSHG